MADIMGTIKGFAEGRYDLLDDAKSSTSIGEVLQTVSPEVSRSLFGQVSAQDWYKIFPYKLIARQNKGKGLPGVTYTYILPIPPESLSCQMIAASDATATLGGVIEETSQNVFWQVSLTGTTGMAISRKDTDTEATQFRSFISTTGLLSGLSSTVNGLLNKVSNVANAVSSLDVAGVVSGITQPSLPYGKSAIPGGEGETNGYKEIIHIQKFLYAYSVLKEQNPGEWELYFINHKDDMKMRVVVQGGLSVQKNAQEPYLYRYRLNMKGWDNTTVVGFAPKIEINRFKGDLSPVNTLTLTGIASSLGALSGKISKANKDGIGGALKLVIPAV